MQSAACTALDLCPAHGTLGAPVAPPPEAQAGRSPAAHLSPAARRGGYQVSVISTFPPNRADYYRSFHQVVQVYKEGRTQSPDPLLENAHPSPAPGPEIVGGLPRSFASLAEMATHPSRGLIQLHAEVLANGIHKGRYGLPEDGKLFRQVSLQVTSLPMELVNDNRRIEDRIDT